MDLDSVFDVPGVTASSFDAGVTECWMQMLDNERRDEMGEGRLQELTLPAIFTHD